jgi:hypothetical protein
VRKARLLNYAGKLLALSVFAVIVPSVGSAADLRLRIDPAAVPREQPLKKMMKEIFEEYLKWRSQQSR